MQLEKFKTLNGSNFNCSIILLLEVEERMRLEAQFHLNGIQKRMMNNWWTWLDLLRVLYP